MIQLVISTPLHLFFILPHLSVSIEKLDKEQHEEHGRRISLLKACVLTI